MSQQTVNLEYAGKEYPATELPEITRVKILEYAAATDCGSALSTDLAAAKAAGFADLVAPPTFLVSLAQATEAQYIQDPEAGIDFSRVVHGDEKFKYERPVIAGDRLTATLRVESVKKVGPHAMVSTSVTFKDSAGSNVAVVTSGLVIRGEENA